MRMPPNLGRLCRLACRRRRFNVGRHAHAAELGTSGRPLAGHLSFNVGRHAHAAEFEKALLRQNQTLLLQCRAACACRRIVDSLTAAISWRLLQCRAACACRRMTGAGRRGPPSRRFNVGRHAHAAELERLHCSSGACHELQCRAACACRRIWVHEPRHPLGALRFNVGRHAHAAEYGAPAGRVRVPRASM